MEYIYFMIFLIISILSLISNIVALSENMIMGYKCFHSNPGQINHFSLGNKKSKQMPQMLP